MGINAQTLAGQGFGQRLRQGAVAGGQGECGGIAQRDLLRKAGAGQRACLRVGGQQFGNELVRQFAAAGLEAFADPQQRRQPGALRQCGEGGAQCAAGTAMTMSSASSTAALKSELKCRLSGRGQPGR